MDLDDFVSMLQGMETRGVELRFDETRAQAQDAAAEVLSLVQLGEVREAPDSELDRLAYDFTWSTTFDAPLGSVAALLTGGNLEVLGDPHRHDGSRPFPRSWRTWIVSRR